jgi:galactose mutarotase-like enzyme
MLIKGHHLGHAALWLENEALRVGVLPEKGADIFELIHRPSGIQMLIEMPGGLKPPSGHPQTEFLENYEGGWQELFPNHGDACEFRGQTLPMHGEVALLPWEAQVIQDNSNETCLHLQVRCQKTPFLLERTMRLRAGTAQLEILGRVTNLSDQACEFVWGHHVTLGEAFLDGQSRLDIPASTVLTPDVLFEPGTARLAPGQTSPWPNARDRQGGTIDLASLPGRSAHSHDDAFLTGLGRGHFTVTSPRRGLRFSLEWNESLFPWIAFWQPYGGAEVAPFTGMYGVGIEPWISRFSLTEAVEKGQAKRLAGGASLQTRLVASVTPL